jgi:hypothetical protein
MLQILKEVSDGKGMLRGYDIFKHFHPYIEQETVEK